VRISPMTSCRCARILARMRPHQRHNVNIKPAQLLCRWRHPLHASPHLTRPRATAPVAAPSCGEGVRLGLLRLAAALPRPLQAMIDEFDTDGDGEISLVEFASIMKSTSLYDAD
jgi:hypothetical protein